MTNPNLNSSRSTHGIAPNMQNSYAGRGGYSGAGQSCEWLAAIWRSRKRRRFAAGIYRRIGTERLASFRAAAAGQRLVILERRPHERCACAEPEQRAVCQSALLYAKFFCSAQYAKLQQAELQLTEV